VHWNQVKLLHVFLRQLLHSLYFGRLESGLWKRSEKLIMRTAATSAMTAHVVPVVRVVQATGQKQQTLYKFYYNISGFVITCLFYHHFSRYFCDAFVLLKHTQPYKGHKSSHDVFHSIHRMQDWYRCSDRCTVEELTRNKCIIAKRDCIMIFTFL
jgi:hypothetical protein